MMTAQPSLAGDDSLCDSYPNVDINVTPVFDEAVIDTSKSLAEIQGLGAGANVVPHYDSITLGVARYRPIIEFRAPMIRKPLSDGTTCARVKKVDATIGYKDVTIFLAKELTSDQCSIRHVLEHEQKHIAVNRAVLNKYANLIQIKLQEYFKLYGMFRVPNPDYAQTLLNEKVDAIFKESAQQMTEENRRRQRAIDTPEEYAKNNTVCSGHINGIIGKAFSQKKK